MKKKLLKLLGKKEDAHLIDLVKHKPSSYINRDYRPVVKDAENGKIATILVEVCQHILPARKTHPTSVICQDETGYLDLIFFHAKKQFVEDQLPVGQKRWISGKVEFHQGTKRIVHPDYILPEQEIDQLPMIEAIYPLTYGVTQKYMNKIMGQLKPSLQHFDEWIEPSLMQQKEWPSWNEAIHHLHFPMPPFSSSDYNKAVARLAYDEVLASQMALQITRYYQRRKQANPIALTGKMKQQCLEKLPFQLTQGQITALSEIENDMSSEQQMLRLLQGDVGSGKTIVAFLAILHIIENKQQAALMVPIDILARQHFEKAAQLLETLNIRIGILTGREKGKKRQKLVQEIAEGQIDLVIGTHAVFQDDVSFKKLGLVIIDEQHRFGVDQRFQLMQKGKNAHLLVMTATPIPRTLLMTQYGDMDVSSMKEKPAGRKPIQTRLMSLNKIEELIIGLKRAMANGSKAYWVCPLVEESEKSHLKAVEERFEYLKAYFGQDHVAMVHGKTKSTEKDKIMQSFKEGNEINLLVATTVIEVGVDVPEATIMVIEHAENFGLAQLHQLRGRVGRGAEDSHCILLYHHFLSEIAKRRLQIMRESNDGFYIAEQDMQLRGSGEILGTRQSGLPKYAFFDFEQHTDLIPVAKKQAQMMVETDPELQSPKGENMKTLLHLFEKKSATKYRDT